jgi:hypothetical protein
VDLLLCSVLRSFKAGQFAASPGHNAAVPSYPLPAYLLLLLLLLVRNRFEAAAHKRRKPQLHLLPLILRFS